MKPALSFFNIAVFTLFLLGGGDSFSQQKEKMFLTILHYNDFHSQNIPFKIPRTDSLGTISYVEVGGYAVLKAYVDNFKAKNPNTILLNAGDDFQGTPVSSITKGKSQIELLELIQSDAMTLGNHEFDYGIENLRNLLSIATFPIISANLFDKSIGAAFVPRYKIIHRGGLKIGVIGIAPPDLKTLCLRENVKALDVLDAESVARQTIDELKNKFNVDIIVILSHMGIDEDSKLAKKVHGIDVIVGGHSHTPLFKPMRVDETYIVQAGSKGRWLGKLDLTFDKQKKKIVSGYGKLVELRTDEVEPDPIVAKKIQELESLVDEGLNEVIGFLETDWVRPQGSQESNIGNWLTDVMRDFAKTDIAFQNSGGIRKDLPAGPITLRDIWEISPFGNQFVKFSITGAQLRTMLERQVKKTREFCQVSGLKYRFDNTVSQEKALTATVNSEPVNPDRIYSVVTSNYVGGHLHDIFNLPEDEIKVETVKPEMIDRDVFIEYIKKHKRISSLIEGRITIIRK